MRKKGWKVIWIDQVCINQCESSSEEKDHQVSLMGQIFSKASLVFVWLGQPENSEEVELSEQDTKRLLTTALQELKSILHQPDPFLKLSKRFKSTNLLLNWNVLLEIFEHPYWKRRWIIQELVTSRIAKVIVGKLILPFYLITWAGTELRNLYNSIQDPYFQYRGKAINDILPESLMNRIKDNYFSANDCAVIGRLKQDMPDPNTTPRACRNFQVSVAQDAIYSLHSLLKGSPEPNYEKSATKVFLQYTCWIIMSGMRPKMFSWIPLVSLRRKDIPSWCFDFISGLDIPEREEIWPDNDISSWSIRSNDFSLLPGLSEADVMLDQEKPFTLVQNNKLSVFGFRIDKITQTFTPSTYETLTEYFEVRKFYLQSIQSRTDLVKSRLIQGLQSSRNWSEEENSRMGDRERTFYCLCNASASGKMIDPLFGNDIVENEEILLFQMFHLHLDGFDTFATTEQGWPVLTSHDCEVGDEVIIINGVTQPIILRRTTKDDYKVIYHCHVAGIMYGNIQELDASSQVEEFILS